MPSRRLALAALLVLAAAAAAPARATQPAATAALAAESSCSAGQWDLTFAEADGVLDDETFALYQVSQGRAKPLQARRAGQAAEAAPCSRQRSSAASG